MFLFPIEVQVRGLPHLHGVFWLNEATVNKYKKDGDFDDLKIVALIDKFVSVSLNTGDSDLDTVVRYG